MKTYYSTFITGFNEVIKQALVSYIKDVKIDLLSDGLIIYKTNASLEAIKQLRFFNNSFLLLKFFPKIGHNPINEMLKQAIGDKRLTPNIHDLLPSKTTAFRIMATIENQFVAIDRNLQEKLESIISQNKTLILNRSKPDVEFLFVARREGYGLFGLRLTRHTSYEKILEKGEIYPELACILCLISEPRADDVFLDPFFGSGTIPITRVVHFPYRSIYAGDNNKQCVDGVKAKVKKIKKPIAVNLLDAIHLTNFDNHSVNKIVTDPPWGLYLGKELSLEKFYEEMLTEFNRVLKRDGLLVVLVGKKELFETVLSKFSKTLMLVKRFDTLVSGQKAGVYKIRKVG